jgi:hypothetical protein
MKFLEAIEHYKKELGLTEAIPGSAPVMSPTQNAPQATGNQAPTTGPVDYSKMSDDEKAARHNQAVQTINDVMTKIKTNSATPKDYEALNLATTDMNAIQSAQSPTTTPTAGVAGTAQASGAKPSNPLIKPLA